MIDLIQKLRRELNGLFEMAGLPDRPPFLHRTDDDDFLLCSDAPRRLTEPASAARLFLEAGLTLQERDGLWFLDARNTDYGHLEASLPVDMPKRPADKKYLEIWAICRMLSEHPFPVSRQPLPAVRRTIKAMEAGDAMVLSMVNHLPAYLSELMRNKLPLPSMAGKLLGYWLKEKMKKEAI